MHGFITKNATHACHVCTEQPPNSGILLVMLLSKKTTSSTHIQMNCADFRTTIRMVEDTVRRTVRLFGFNSHGPLGLAPSADQPTAISPLAAAAADTSSKLRHKSDVPLCPLQE